MKPNTLDHLLLLPAALIVAALWLFDLLLLALSLISLKKTNKPQKETRHVL